MADLLRAMSISGGILLPIVILIIIISIATVNRGVEQMGGHHDLAPGGHGATAHGGAVAAAAPAKKAVGEVVEDISVMQVLLFGIVLFTAVMGLLLLVSVIQHS